MMPGQSHVERKVRFRPAARQNQNQARDSPLRVYALGLRRALAWMRMAVPVCVGYLIAALPDSGDPKN